MWLYGPAGAGKSAVAQTMAEKWAEDGKLGAAFFFARWRAGGGLAQQLFTTIAFQLALNFPALREAIVRAVEFDPTIPERNLEAQAYGLIVAPMKTLNLGPAAPFMIVIDGLDECDGKPIQVLIINIIRDLIHLHDLPLRFFVASRPEPHLREVLDQSSSSSLVSRLVLDHTFGPSLDILHYLRERFAEIDRKRYPNRTETQARNEWPSTHDLERLVQNASGHFIYAATVIKFVDDEYSLPEDRLRVILDLKSSSPSAFADLDLLYHQILSANPDTPLVVRVLGAYFVLLNGGRKCTIWFLQSLLGLPPGVARLALSGLHSILSIPTSDELAISVHHASLWDYLTNQTRSQEFFLDMVRHNGDLSLRCLSIVQESLVDPYRYPESMSVFQTFSFDMYAKHIFFQSCLLP